MSVLETSVEGMILLGKEFSGMKSIEHQLYEEYCLNLHEVGMPTLPCWKDVSMKGKDAWHAVLMKALEIFRDLI